MDAVQEIRKMDPGLGSYKLWLMMRSMFPSEWTPGREEPEMPDGEFLMDEENVKVKFNAKEGRVVAWLTFEIKERYDIRRELYTLTSKIDKCFAFNENSVCPQK